MSNEGYFIKVHNMFMKAGSKYKLNEKELYIYSYLYTERNFENKIKTCIELLDREIKFRKSSKTQNQQDIRLCLKALKDKGVITYAEENNVLVIKFKKIDDKGFEQIEYREFRSFNNYRDYYIYSTVARFRNTKIKGFICPYSEWGKIMEVSDRQAKTIIQGAVERKVIYVKKGGYTANLVEGRGQKKQETNVYFVTPIDTTPKDEQDVEDIHYNKEEQVRKKVCKNNNSKENDKNIPEKIIIDKEVREHRWYERGANLQDKDFVVYLTTTDTKLKENAKRRIEAISGSKNGEKFVEDSLSRASEIIEEQQRIQQAHIREEERLNEEDKLKKMKGTPIELANGTVVDVTDIKQITEGIKRIYYFKEEMVPNDYGMSEINEVLVETSLRSMLFDISEADDISISKEVMEEVEMFFYKIIQEGKLKRHGVEKVVQYFKSICEKMNKKRGEKEKWEGDMILYHNGRVINTSLEERMQKCKDDKQNERLLQKDSLWLDEVA